MSSDKKILEEVRTLRSLGEALVERATRLEAQLTGEGIKPVSSRKGIVRAEASAYLAKRMNKRA